MFNFFLGYMLGSSSDEGGDEGAGCFSFILGMIGLTVLSWIVMGIYFSYQWINGLAENFSLFSILLFPYIVQDVFDFTGITFVVTSVVINVFCFKFILKAERKFITMPKTFKSVISVGLLNIYLFALFIRQALMGGIQLFSDGSYILGIVWFIASAVFVIAIFSMQEDYKKLKNAQKLNIRALENGDTVKEFKLKSNRFDNFFSRFYKGEHRDIQGNYYDHGVVFEIPKFLHDAKEDFAAEYQLGENDRFFEATIGLLRNPGNQLIEFGVYLDNVRIFRQEFDGNTSPKPIRLEIQNGEKIIFMVKALSDYQNGFDTACIGIFDGAFVEDIYSKDSAIAGA